MVIVSNKPCVPAEPCIKSLVKGTPAECAYGNKSLAGVWWEPHCLHQAKVEHAQCKAAHHIGEVVFPQQHPGHAHQKSPKHQQNSERHSQDQMGKQEFGDHRCSAGMSSREGVDVHGDTVQKAGSHLPGSSALHQSLNSGHSHDINDEGCHTKQGLIMI